MMTSLQDRRCPECLEQVKGRADKKFCSDGCRTAYNNRLNSDCNNFMKNINNILRRNRRILTALRADGKRRVSLENLKARGFCLDYFTSVSRTKDGVLYYCYEQAYQLTEEQECLLILKKDIRISL